MKITELHEDNRPPQPSGNPPLDATTLQEHETARDGAFQGFMAAREQTYKQFMEAFMELTPEDVEQFNSRHQQPITPPVSQTHVNLGSSNSNNEKKEAKQSTLPTPQPQQHDRGSDLEEEVLGEGDVVPSRLMRPESPGRLKMDNFVDDEQVFSSDDEDAATSSGYQASFGPTPAALEKTTQHTPELSTQPQTQNIQSVPCPPPSPQSPEPTKAPKGRESPKNTPEPEPNLRDEFPDSEPVLEERIEPARLPNEDNEEDEEQSVYDPTQDKPNPGEVDDKVEMTGMTADTKKTTCLEFSVRTEDGSPKVESEKQAEEKETATDAVQPFALDEEFDYDNVVLTPKYSQEEMAILKTLMK